MKNKNVRSMSGKRIGRLAPRRLRWRSLHRDPFRQFKAWFRLASDAGVKYPEIMALATADRRGRASVRIVLLKEVDETGFVFYTNHESRKGKEMGGRRYAALAFYWPDVGRQVRIEGPVTRIAREKAAAYFATRPRESQISAWASLQSSLIPSRVILLQYVAEVTKKFRGGSVPMPPFWGGYRLKPKSIEFWQGGKDRLHDRIQYTRFRTGWRMDRLSP